MTRVEIRLLILFAILFACGAGSVLVVSLRAERQLVAAMENDLKNVVNTVHYSVQRLSAETGPDREVLERFIEEARQNKAVREISVIGSTNEVIASSNPAKVGQHHELSGEEIVLREHVGGARPSDHKIRYDIKVPLFRDQQVVGLVQADLEMADYRFVLHQLYSRNLLISACAVVLAFGVVMVAMNRLNRPLRRLIMAADQVAAGDLTVSVTPEHGDEVGRLTASFNAMTGRLAEQRKLEDKLHEMERHALLAEVASNLAHEIRNPLNLINLTADYLSRQYQPEAEERKKSFQELISTLKAEVRRLNETVTAFTNMVRPSALKRSKFTWEGLVLEAERFLKSSLLAKSVDLEFSGEADLAVDADREQMRLALTNLLLNAVEAVPTGGHISIRVDRHGSQGETRLSVVDDGPGIPPEDLPRVFEPYFTTRSTGTGLGLALVRRVVEEHGGSVLASNEPTGGARFEVMLPAEG